jgi:drug/metabolite transporter (DMT)-like permease
MLIVDRTVKENADRGLLILLLTYCGASLIHFIHNAEFLSHYPGLPASWSSFGVYLAWVVMTVIGAMGSVLYFRGYRRVGLAILAVYAALGLDSLGHYVLAPLSSHTTAMNSTILMEVGAAALVLCEVVRRAFGEMRRPKLS